MLKKKSVFDKIEKFLYKKGHQLCMSIYLDGYNGNNIYIRFDYVPKLSCYKIVWFDLNFFDEKNIEKYVNVQMVTKVLSVRLVNLMTKKDYTSDYDFDDRIIGDRVEILSYFKENVQEFVFDRFLPLKWKFLVDPLAIIFSYLPRSMEVFLNEMFAKYDGIESNYNFRKPIKFDLFNGNLEELFKSSSINIGRKYVESGAVSFLEKIDNKYYAIVDERRPFLVVITDMGDNTYKFKCGCNTDNFCRHVCAVIMAIRDKRYKKFYKVKYTGREETLLEKVTLSNFYLCFGVDEDKLLIISGDEIVMPLDILHNGKKVFEVLEDDDNLSLSRILDDYK